MASTSVTSPPLSYAERARRAQNIKSKISAPPPQTYAPKAEPVTPSPSAGPTTTASASAIPPASNSIDGPAPSLIPNPPSVATSTASTLVASPELKASSASATLPQTQLAVQALSIVAAHTTGSSPVKPPQNVWSLRAAARAAASTKTPDAASPPPPSLGGDAAKPASDASANTGLRPTMTNTPSSVSLNDSSALSSLPSDNLPSKGQAPSQPLPDPENWPQVGVKSVATNGLLPPLPLPDTRPNGPAAQSSASPRKAPWVSDETSAGEKTKWVAIPAAELQAAADALKPRPQPSRKQPRSGSNNTSANNARNPSGRTSAAHSRTQSRAASASSSPRNGGRNAGKKLPSSNDASLPSELASIPSSSSNPPNPSVDNQTRPTSYPHPLPTNNAYPLQSHPLQTTQFNTSSSTFYPQSHQSPTTPSRHLASPTLPLSNLINSVSSSLALSATSSAYPSHSISSNTLGHAGPNGSIPYAYQAPVWNAPNQHHPVPNHDELVSLVMRQHPEEPTPRPADGGSLNGSAQPTSNGDIPAAKPDSSSTAGGRETMTFGSITLGETRSTNAASTGPGGEQGAGTNSNSKANTENKGDSSSSPEKMANGKENATPKAKGKEGRGKKGKVSPSPASAPQHVSQGDGAEGASTSGPPTKEDPKEDEIKPATSQQSTASQQVEVKYKFGTASSTPPAEVQAELAAGEAPPPTTTTVNAQASNLALGAIQTSNTLPADMSRLAVHDASLNNRTASFPLDPRGSVSYGQMPHPHIHAQPAAASGPVEPSMGVGASHLPPPHPHHHPHPHAHSHPHPHTHGAANRAGMDPDLTVKDYGFGFGTPRLQRELGVERQREISAWMETHNRHYISPPAAAEEGAEYTWGGHPPRGDGFHANGRGRRGGYGGPGPSGGSNRGGGGFGAASTSGGYQSGTGSRRGRGAGGSSGANGFSRGYGGRGRGGGGSSSHRPAERGAPPPFTVTPPPHLQPLGLPPPSENIYYGPRPMPPGYHHPMQGSMNGFDPYAPQLMPPVPLSLPNPPVPHISPPVPVPLSPISFPLDPTRYYLLGQLEYYLSPQNMASDFFLRQRMDSRGWIPIPLIASFNRVKQLTNDEALVRDVLMLSSLVQVWDNSVRMGGWERFVLPDASPSTVEEPPYAMQPLMDAYGEHPHHHPHPSLSPYESQPPQTNGLQLDLGSERPVEEEDLSSEAQLGNGGVAAVLVEGEKVAILHVNGHAHVHADHRYASTSEAEHDEDEEEEDDVVFVMGHEEGTWSSPERRA